MKKLFLVILATLWVSSSQLALAAEGGSEKIIAYYFHGSFRCFTCNAMEKYAREAVDNNFQNELKSGKLEFREVNVESPGNEHYIKDYGLFTKSLILSLEKDGEEERSKNLDKIWLLARDKEKFIAYVTDELKEFLKEVQ